VPGVVLIVVAMVLVLPVGVMLAGAVWSALTGFLYSGEPDTEPPAP
jgi:hypothetical protein